MVTLSHCVGFCCWTLLMLEELPDSLLYVRRILDSSKLWQETSSTDSTAGFQSLGALEKLQGTEWWKNQFEASLFSYMFTVSYVFC